VTGYPVKVYTGDLLEPYREHIQSGMFHGIESIEGMLSVSAMGMYLSGVKFPNLLAGNALGSNLREEHPEIVGGAFDVILANPPWGTFSRGDEIDSSLHMSGRAPRAECAFVARILEMLKNPGGRAAVLVPGVFLSSRDSNSLKIRTELLEHNSLDAVVRLGRVDPKATSEMAILVFSRAGSTEQVFFYDLRPKGRAKSQLRFDSRGLAVAARKCADRWAARDPSVDTTLTDRGFFVSSEAIAERGYSLEYDYYCEHTYESPEYDKDRIYLDRLRKIREQTEADLNGLEDMLG
jgi:type I restriction enzyme M protein